MTIARDIRLDVLGVSRERWIAEKEAAKQAPDVPNETPGPDDATDESTTEPHTGLLERVDILPSWRGERKRPEAQVLESLEVPAGTTVGDAIERSRVLEQCPEIDLGTFKVGIFGKLAKPDQMLEAGDSSARGSLGVPW